MEHIAGGFRMWYLDATTTTTQRTAIRLQHHATMIVAQHAANVATNAAVAELQYITVTITV